MTLKKGDEVRMYDWGVLEWYTVLFVRKTKNKYILTHPAEAYESPFFDINKAETISYSKKEMKTRIINSKVKYYFKD